MPNEKQNDTWRTSEAGKCVGEKRDGKCSVQNQRERPQNKSDTNSCFSSQPPTRFHVTRHVAFTFA